MILAVSGEKRKFTGREISRRKTRLHDRKIRYGPVKKASGPHIFVRMHIIFILDRCGHAFLLGFNRKKNERKKKKKKNTDPDEFLESYVSLCNDFTDRMRSTVVSN